ncbi:MAG: hypothetical protein HY911_07690 [Desulfobacterales bacterium]|nr:hypothetical protein [Desulfobacterales bacterium]
MNTSTVTSSNHAFRRGFVQNRMQNFGWTMIVMGASFGLYYLGLFGTVEGPLRPERIGDQLAAVGFTNRHLLMGLLSLMGIAIVWNWIYNGICRLLGRRMTCACRAESADGFCAAPVRRERPGHYVCADGHARPDARFHPLAKGTVAHFMWMMFAIFSAIVYYLM